MEKIMILSFKRKYVGILEFLLKENRKKLDLNKENYTHFPILIYYGINKLKQNICLI